MARRKKKNEEEHENSERWLVSYADFITLLFAFFVTMYSVSRVDGKKMGSAVESLQRALGSLMPVQMTQKDPGVFQNQAMPIQFSIVPIEGKPYTAEARAFQKVAKKIHEEVSHVPQHRASDPQTRDQIKFILEKRGLVIRVSEQIFFNSGEAAMRPKMIPILNVIAKALETLPNQIRIEGHTDNIPINTPLYPSNWELSTARATTIVRFLLAYYDFSPDRLSATGYAEFRPIESNDTTEGRLQNRRVDFVILSNKEMELEPPKNESVERKEPS